MKQEGYLSSVMQDMPVILAVSKSFEFRVSLHQETETEKQLRRRSWPLKQERAESVSG